MAKDKPELDPGLDAEQVPAELAEQPETDTVPEELDPVAYRLAGEVTALRHTVGHNEVSLDDVDVYVTRSADEMAALDALEALERCEVPA